jgi:TatD DNase family protein
VVQQLWAFEEQIKLAIELQLPLFLHDRESNGDMARVLAKYAGKLPPFVIHCFSGTEAELDAYLELGAYISVTGFVAMAQRGASLRTFIGKVPHDRLTMNTDAPYMSPDGAENHGARVKTRPNSNRKEVRNEPCFLPLLLPTLAACFNLPEERIAEMTTANARRLFGL